MPSSNPECRRDHKRDRGYVLITVGVSLVALISFAGLVFDTGQLFFYKRLAQSAADAGALGGTREATVNPTNISVAAKDDTASNGFTDGANNVTVTVNVPPASGAFSGNSKAVEVIVTRKVPTLFLGVLNIMDMSVRARAVGKLGGATDCVLALDPTASGALTLQGNVTVTAEGCSFVVDSNASNAMMVGNSSCISAKDINITGNYTSGGCAPSPTPNINMTPLVDPLADLQPPTFNGCDNTHFKINGNGTNTTLLPGVYCDGITVTGSGNTLDFQPGMYILNGGGMNISGGNTIRGTDVTFYNTGNNFHQYSDFSISGGVHLALHAPDSGTYASILFFQDRSWPSKLPHGNIISGDSTSTLDGVIYMPSGVIEYQGNSSATGYTNIVARTVTFSGNSTIKSNYGTLADGPPLKTQAAIVE